MTYAENIKAGMTIKNARGDWVKVSGVKFDGRYTVYVVCENYQTLCLSRGEPVEYRG